MAFRRAAEDEYDAVLALVVREQPHLEPSEFAPILYDRELAPECAVLVAEERDGLVGCAVLVRLAFDPPEHSVGSLVVAAARRGRGIGHALKAALEDAITSGTTEIRGRVYDDDTRSLAVAEHWGYQRREHEIFSRLDLVDVAAPHLPEGLAITAHHDYQPPDAEEVNRMLDASQTNPERETLGVLDLSRLLASAARNETPLLVVTRIEGAPVALSTALVSGDLAYIGYTGVDPAFRGRGLARLTKQALHVEARAAGARACLTANEQNNRGIRRINAEMGFVVEHGIWRVTKNLET